MKRQLAAILYADVAGYSRLMAGDEADTHRRVAESLAAFTAKIVEGGGHKANQAGDAILVEFSSVSAAIDTAIAFQSDMAGHNEGLDAERRLEYRVGIHLGEVIESNGDIFGDDVNIAARIQELAEPGGLAVSSAVYERAGSKTDVVFSDLGYQRLKNIERPVHVFAAAAASLGGDAHPVAFLSAKVAGQPLFDLDGTVIDKPVVAQGGCLCGRIRYQTTGEPAGTGFCHCRICQRALGAPVNAWAAFIDSDVQFEDTEPEWYRSSPIAERAFCSRCGTSLGYRMLKPDTSHYLILNIPCLDDPTAYAPTWHGSIESQLPFMDFHDELPRLKSPESPALKKAWESVGVVDPADWKPGD